MSASNVAVHLGDGVVIVEGGGGSLRFGPAFAERVYAASVAKYGTGSHDTEGSYAVRLRLVFA